MPLSDSSDAYARALRPEPLPAVLLRLLAGGSDVSRFSCMKLPDVSGVYDYAGPNRNARYRPCSCCLPPMQKRRRPDCIFSELNTQPACTPVYASPCASRRTTQNSGPRVRYSFLVGLLHSLLHAGLSRRTASAMMRSLIGAPSVRESRNL